MGKNADALLKDEKQGMISQLEGLKKKIASGKASAQERDQAAEIARKLDTKKYRSVR